MLFAKGNYSNMRLSNERLAIAARLGLRYTTMIGRKLSRFSMLIPVRNELMSGDRHRPCFE
jgi:hypothetical protein